MSEESLIAESYSNLKSAILLGRTDIVRGILSTAAESKFCNIIHVIFDFLKANWQFDNAYVCNPLNFTCALN